MRRSYRIFTAICALVFLLTPPLHSAPSPADASAVILVELFTSEGCSSCPPADALLRQINNTHTDTGALVVGISEHVTYWNSLGWSDPFSSELYTTRQSDYGSRFRLDSVYTPQIVVNGREQFVGSDRASLLKALHTEQTQIAPVTLHILTANVEGDTLTATFTAAGVPPSEGVELFAVLAQDQAESRVLRGENSGHTLSHVAVARTLNRIARLPTGSEQRTERLPLPVALRTSQGRHLILFAQSAANGRILGATTQAF